MNLENVRPVQVEYDRVSEQDVLFQIDGLALSQALVECGYPPSSLGRLIISGKNLINTRAR